MKPTAELFDLIQSLTQTEKRFFKVYASRHVIGGKNNYVKIFEAIEKQKVYDENKILKKFQQETFIKHFASEKYYLYNLVLDSLDAYHADSSVENRLYRMLHFSEILFKKSLYGACSKVLERAEKIAVTHDKFYEAVKIIARRRELIYKNPETANADYEILIDDTFSAQEELFKKINNVQLMNRLYTRVFALYKRMGLVRNREAIARMEKLMNHPLLKNPSAALSPDALRYYYGAHIISSHATDDHEQCYRYNKELVRLIESDAEKISESKANYISALNGLLITCLRLKNFTGAESTLIKLKELRKDKLVERSPDLQLRLFETYCTHELDYHIKTKSWGKGLNAVRDAETEMKKIGEIIDKGYQLVLWSNITAVFLGAKKYRDALKWNNLIINEQEKNIREDIICFARIVNLIIHFELDNVLQLPYLLKSAYRYLHKRNRIFRYENCMLNAIRDILKTKETTGLIPVFAKLKKELTPLLSDPFEKHLFEEVDIISWLEEKIGRHGERRNT